MNTEQQTAAENGTKISNLTSKYNDEMSWKRKQKHSMSSPYLLDI